MLFQLISKLNKEKKHQEEINRKLQEDLQGEEDKVNHLNKVKAKLEQTLDEVRNVVVKTACDSHSKMYVLEGAFRNLRYRLPIRAYLPVGYCLSQHPLGAEKLALFPLSNICG